MGGTDFSGKWIRAEPDDGIERIDTTEFEWMPVKNGRTIIAVDVDDVLVEFYAAFAEFHNRMYGTAICKESFTSYFVHEVVGGGVEDAKVKIWAFYASDSFKCLPLVNGARQAIRCLAEAHELVAVTGRPHGVAPITERMLDQYFYGCFTAVHHTDAFRVGSVTDAWQPKADLCIEIGADVIIEDYFGHAVPCAEAGVRVVLFDQPWNRWPVVPYDRISRVHSWDEALTFLL